MSPYAISKLASENYLAFYNRLYGLDYTVLRYANVYGPRQSPGGEAGVVAIFMDRLLKGLPCRLYRYKNEPRGMTRDYCYVGDVARANVAALRKGSRQAYNIGTGRPTHTRELFDAVYRSVKSRLPDMPAGLDVPESADARPGDLERSCLDAGKAGRELGWAHTIGLEKGIELTLDWRIGLERVPA